MSFGLICPIITRGYGCSPVFIITRGYACPEVAVGVEERRRTRRGRRPKKEIEECTVEATLRAINGKRVSIPLGGRQRKCFDRDGNEIFSSAKFLESLSQPLDPVVVEAVMTAIRVKKRRS